MIAETSKSFQTFETKYFRSLLRISWNKQKTDDIVQVKLTLPHPPPGARVGNSKEEKTIVAWTCDTPQNSTQGGPESYIFFTVTFNLISFTVICHSDICLTLVNFVNTRNLLFQPYNIPRISSEPCDTQYATNFTAPMSINSFNSYIMWVFFLINFNLFYAPQNEVDLFEFGWSWLPFIAVTSSVPASREVLIKVVTLCQSSIWRCTILLEKHFGEISPLSELLDYNIA